MDDDSTAVTRLAEAGCTVPEIAAITGHTLRSVTAILEHYLSRTAALAAAGIAKLERRSRNENGNQMETANRRKRGDPA